MPTRARIFTNPLQIPDATDATHAATKQQLDAGVTAAKNLNTATGKLQATNIDVNSIPNDRIIGLTALLNAAVAGLVNGAPGALDTIGELATMFGNNPNYATEVGNLLATHTSQITALQNAGPGLTVLRGNVPVINPNATGSVTHGRGREVLCQVYTAAGQLVDPVLFDNVDGSNIISFDFGAYGAAANQYRYVIV